MDPQTLAYYNDDAEMTVPRALTNQHSDLSVEDLRGMMQYHTGGWDMGKAKIAITIDERIVGRIDRLVKQRTFSNRSQAIEEAMHEKLARLDKSRLAREAAKLDPKAEKEMAEEGLAAEQEFWPEF